MKLRAPTKRKHCGRENRQMRKFRKMLKKHRHADYLGNGQLFIGGARVGRIVDAIVEHLRKVTNVPVEVRP